MDFPDTGVSMVGVIAPALSGIRCRGEKKTGESREKRGCPKGLHAIRDHGELLRHG
jgi:hypothetical protein